MKSKSRKNNVVKKIKEIQFSKEMCKKSWRLMAFSVIICLLGEFFLQYTGRGSMEGVVTVVLSLISFVTVFINGGYITQNIFRDTSLNKHGIFIDEENKSKSYMTYFNNNNESEEYDVNSDYTP